MHGYRTFSDAKIIPHAALEKVDHIQRCLSGIPYPFHNAILDSSGWNGSWKECVREQIDYFKNAHVPFVWYVDEHSNPELEQVLISQSFSSLGVFQGVIAILDKTIATSSTLEGFTFEQVSTEKELDDFNTLVCKIFGMENQVKDMFKTVLLNDMRKVLPIMCHWMAKKQGQIVSTLSALIKNNVVSFWNGATLPDLRRQGLCTALTRIALQDSIQKGCIMGTSYLTSDSLAENICRDLIPQVKWKLLAYLSPLQIQLEP